MPARTRSFARVRRRCAVPVCVAIDPHGSNGGLIDRDAAAYRFRRSPRRVGMLRSDMMLRHDIASAPKHLTLHPARDWRPQCRSHRLRSVGYPEIDRHFAWPAGLWMLRPGLVLIAKRKMTLAGGQRALRSEEHTSELQSPDHLVCRLL